MESDKSFNARPAKGWLHNDATIMNGGITFSVKYIGCIEILTSMKLLDFCTRSLVAKECINRVCDAAQVKTPKKRRVEKRIQQSIKTTPCMEHAGTNVILNISSRCLELRSLDTNEIIARHDMPRISFVSGGDADTLDFVAYVAKDITDWRACYVLECGGGKAQDIISTMGQAFDLRYKEFYGMDHDSREASNESRQESIRRKQSLFSDSAASADKCDLEYYNDLPGKVPPEFDSNEMPTSPLNKRRRDRIHSNLIDFNTPIEHDYVNDDKRCDSDGNLSNDTDASINHNNNVVVHADGGDGKNGSTRDVFDMHCFSLSADVQRSQLMIENWYHGPITRAMSEALLKADGDFLVRESTGSPGQYVLTGSKSGQARHLLLVDPEGCVRTKDRVFESIPHLINYHWTNCLPIISADSPLLLRTPVIRTTDLRQ